MWWEGKRVIKVSNSAWRLIPKCLYVLSCFSEIKIGCIKRGNFGMVYPGKMIWLSKSGNPFTKKMSWLKHTITCYDFLTFQLTILLPVSSLLDSQFLLNIYLSALSIFLLIIRTNLPPYFWEHVNYWGGTAENTKAEDTVLVITWTVILEVTLSLWATFLIYEVSMLRVGMEDER